MLKKALDDHQSSAGSRKKDWGMIDRWMPDGFQHEYSQVGSRRRMAFIYSQVGSRRRIAFI